MSRLTCLLADDEPLALRLLEKYVERTDALEQLGAYTSATQALEAIRRQHPDLALLDIQMPGMNGIELARAARDCGTRVIFVTAYRDFALEGFRVNALDYLLKPVSYEEFLEAVGRAMPLPEQAPIDHIIVKSDYKQVKIRLSEILFIEGLKDYIKIHIEGRERPLLTQMSLKAAGEMLPGEQFMRVHRSYIVALDRISRFDRNTLTINGVNVPVGATFRDALSERL